MSSCSFSVSIPDLAENMVNKAKSAIEGQGGHFDGDLTSGRFKVQVLGEIEGSYTITGQLMNIQITSKPMFITCSQIESFMKNQLSR
jgi:hypothetical protein